MGLWMMWTVTAEVAWTSNDVALLGVDLLESSSLVLLGEEMLGDAHVKSLRKQVAGVVCELQSWDEMRAGRDP